MARLVKREFRAGKGYWYGLNLSVITDRFRGKVKVSVITDKIKKIP